MLSCGCVVVNQFGHASSPSASVFLWSPGYRFKFAFLASPSGSAVASLSMLIHFSLKLIKTILLSCVRVVVDWFRYTSSPSTSVYLLSPGYRFKSACRASPSGSAFASLSLCMLMVHTFHVALWYCSGPPSKASMRANLRKGAGLNNLNTCSAELQRVLTLLRRRASCP